MRVIDNGIEDWRNGLRAKEISSHGQTRGARGLQAFLEQASEAVPGPAARFTTMSARIETCQVCTGHIHDVMFEVWSRVARDVRCSSMQECC